MLTLAICCLPVLASAGQNEVTYVGTYGDGDVFIGFTSAVSGAPAACGKNRIDLPKDWPGLDKIVATALTAASTGMKVDVSASANACCLNGYPTFSADKACFIYLLPIP